MFQELDLLWHKNIVDYRTEIGAFQNRKELLKVPKLGAKAFEQCAGFLRIANGNQPLDNSSVHPERYALVEKMAKSIQTSISELLGDEQKIKSIPIAKFVDDEVGNETLNDIIAELQKPGRDPRKMVKVFEFDKTIRTIDDLQVGKELPGIVNNITNFGAFVDIGIKENGMIHISNLADEFISNPSDVIALHQHVKVEVISMDKKRKRIGLKLIS
jgi:protein Tex